MPDPSEGWVEKAEGDVRTALRELVAERVVLWAEEVAGSSGAEEG